MASATSSWAKMPVSIMEVKEVVTGSDPAARRSSYFFTLNIFMLPCRLMAPAHIAVRATQK